MRGNATVHTTMAELLEEWPGARAEVARRGMACLGCPMARFETIGEAAGAYGIDPRRLLHDLTGKTPVSRGRDVKEQRWPRHR